MYSVSHDQPLVEPIQPLKTGNEGQVWHTHFWFEGNMPSLLSFFQGPSGLTSTQLRLLGSSSNGALELTLPPSNVRKGGGVKVLQPQDLGRPDNQGHSSVSSCVCSSCITKEATYCAAM